MQDILRQLSFVVTCSLTDSAGETMKITVPVRLMDQLLLAGLMAQNPGSEREGYQRKGENRNKVKDRKVLSPSLCNQSTVFKICR